MSIFNETGFIDWTIAHIFQDFEVAYFRKYNGLRIIFYVIRSANWICLIKM